MIETVIPAALDVATPDLHSRILAMLRGEIEEGEYEPILIPKNLPTKPRRLKAKTIEGLLILDKETIQPAGECPGGRYIYVTEVDRAVRLLRYWTSKNAWAAVDLETGCSWRDSIDGKTGEKKRVYFSKGVDANTACIFLCSVSVEPGRAVVFDMRTLMKEEAFNDAFREFLTECRLVAHNSQFEQSFFAAHFKVTGNVVYDTMVVNQLMTAGRKGSSDLDGMMQRYMGIKLEKDYQKLFIRIHPISPVPDGAIAYSAADVCQLLALAQKVDKDLRESTLAHIWDEIEQPLMQWMVEAKVHEICINPEVFIKLSDEMDVRMKDVLGKLAELCPTVANVNSHPQLKAWFLEQKLPLKSTNEDTLAKVIKDCPDTLFAKVAELILEFRGYHKLKTSYAVPFLEEHPSAKTGRIHAWWKQTSTVTGRMACSPGLQTLPSKGEFVWIRNAIVAEEGHTLCWIDLSQFEVRGLAEMSGEPSMINSFNEQYEANEELDQYCVTSGLKFRGADVLGLADKANGKDEKAEKAKAKYAEIVAAHPQIGALVEKLATLDFHKRTASVLFQKPVSEVTKDERTKAKVVTFAVPYGAGPPGIAEQAKIPIETATELLEEYYNKHPVVKQFLDRCKLQAVRKGFTETLSGRRRYYDLPRQDLLVCKAKELKADPERTAEWEKLKASYDWNRTNDPVEIAQKQYRAQIGAIEREGTNQPIQCIVGSSKVLDQDRGYVPIASLTGQEVDLWDGERFSKSLVLPSGKKQLVKVTLMGGHYIECSPDHRFLVRDTQGRERWVTAERLGQLGKNNRVVLTDPVPGWKAPLDINPVRQGKTWNAKTCDLSQIEDLTSMGVWLGRIASDGYVTPHLVALLVAEHEKVILSALSGIMTTFGHVGYGQAVKRGYTAPMHHLTASSRTLAEQLQTAGVKERIPDFVWQDSELLSGYLRGMFDGDGTVHPDGAILTFGKKPEKTPWAREIQEALLLLGIRSRVRHYPGDRTVVQVLKYDMPLFCLRVGFLNPRKQAAALTIAGSSHKGSAAYGRAASVKSVETTDEWVEMYDAVNSETGRFMANGVVVHNSLNADVTKLATVMAAPRLKELHKDITIIMWVHDEIVLTAPTSLVNQAAAILKECMIAAGQRWLKKVPVEVSVSLGSCWGK